ncbi:MAG TPA: YciI family protein [Mycobacterium sp.]|nr:YciI family protein [Mycobacterium sp.]
MSIYFFRLNPPRADFAQTMTPDEQQAMAAHQQYWEQLLRDGRVVVYGPVADPEGVWGLGVLRAADRAEVLAIAERDPSVVAGVNTFDVFEVMDGVTG